MCVWVVYPSADMELYLNFIAHFSKHATLTLIMGQRVWRLGYDNPIPIHLVLLPVVIQVRVYKSHVVVSHYLIVPNYAVRKKSITCTVALHRRRAHTQPLRRTLHN